MKTTTRILLAGAILFALLSAALFAAHVANRRLVAKVATELDEGRPLTDAQRLCRYVDFAYHDLRRNRLEDIDSWLVRLYYMLNPMHPGPGDVIRWGTDPRGPCGSSTRVVHALLKARGVRSRVLLIRNAHGESIHTVLQTLIDGRWVVADPSFGIVYQRRDGALATVEDLVADPANFRAQVDTVPEYRRAYDYDSVTLLNWQKIPVILPALHGLLTWILGPEKVKEMARPEIWMWPRGLMSLVCLAVSVVLALLAWWSSSGRRKTRSPRPA